MNRRGFLSSVLGFVAGVPLVGRVVPLKPWPFTSTGQLYPTYFFADDRMYLVGGEGGKIHWIRSDA